MKSLTYYLFNRRVMRRLGHALAVIIFVGVATLYVTSAPGNFPFKKTVTIPKSTTLSGAAKILKESHIIRSELVYKGYVTVLGGSRRIVAGSYLFDEPQSALRVAYRLIKGIEGLERIRVTIPEGVASPDIARLLAKEIPGFDSKKFLTLARPLEGQLFPDTYFFYEVTTPEEVVEAMHGNFERQTRGAYLQNTLSRRSFNDVLIMASILEEEASNPDDRRIISGILWKRLDAGMALQVDAPFFYIFGKVSSELTQTDLATSSPYNTYAHRGLPPKPISNPGLDAIKAALSPEKSSYWFYLADYTGVTHYADTHEKHVENKVKYL
jgi:UPF0755 protein